jgi:hypothetical protein
MIVGIVQALDTLGMVMNFFPPDDTTVAICRDNGWVPIEEGSDLYHGGYFVGAVHMKFTAYNESYHWSWIFYMAYLLVLGVVGPIAIVLGYSN